MAYLINVPRSLLRARMVRRRVKIIIIGMCLLVFFMLVITAQSSKTVQQAKNEVTAFEHRKIPPPLPTFVPQAYQVAIDYLDAIPTNVPTATGIDPSLGRLKIGASGVASGPAAAIPYTSINLYSSNQLPPDTGGGVGRVIDTFLVQGTAAVGAPVTVSAVNASAPPPPAFFLSVTMRGTPSGPQIATLPSFGPAIFQSVTNPALDWSGYPQATLTSGATSQIDTWALAYTTNNETGLYQLTGDPTQHIYYGMPGSWNLIGEPKVTSATTRGQQALVQVQMTIAPTATPNAVINESFDLLLAQIDRPLPPIVAWGPAGTGWNLTPFTNANAGSTPIPTTSVPLLGS